MIKRHLTDRLLDALKDTPVVLLQGARQTGKSTLAAWVATGPHRARYVTLDDPTTLAAASADPSGFLDQEKGNLVIDEVQRVPEIFRALKIRVDRDRRPGRYLLTGSSHVLAVPRAADSLVGRMQALTLRPFSQGEMAGVREGFVAALIGGRALPNRFAAPEASDIQRRILAGGYPEPVDRKTPERRRAWHASYITTIMQRDVREMAAVESLAAFPRLLGALAARAARPLGSADISRDLGMPYTTLRRYLALLEASFLLHLIPAWAPNQGQRFVKAPKVVLGDTGMMAYLAAASPERLLDDAALRGRMLENFVIIEIVKQAEWMPEPPAVHHYRTHTGEEVDAVLEDARGKICGVEIKHAAALKAEDFKGLRGLKAAAGSRFQRGVVLYLGRESLPFGDGLAAVPVTALWAPE